MTRITPRAQAFLLSAALLFTAAPSLAAEDAGPETWYAEAFTQSESGLRVIYHWSKGRKFRSEIILGGVPVIYLVSGSTYYAIDSLSQRGMAIERGPKALAEDAKGGRPFLNDGDRLIAAGAEKTDSERVAGRPVDVYRTSEEPLKKTVWVTQDNLHLPVKMEIFDRKSSQTATTHVDWGRDLEIPDAFFEPDPRITLERMSYEEYKTRSQKGPVGPVPALFSDLIHGS